jgi:hypothetical protein
MTTLELKLQLPTSLAREAEAAGLLTPQAIEKLLFEEMRRRRINHLFDAADRLTTTQVPPMTPEEIEAEIDAARAERRKSRASHS